MTILIAFHQGHYRNFKSYYHHQVRQYWSDAFPGLVSYSRFVTWMSWCMMPLCCYLKTCFGADTGIGFVDATSLKVCHNRRIDSHRVFKGIAARGKTSVDWFYRLKLHLIVNECGGTNCLLPSAEKAWSETGVGFSSYDLNRTDVILSLKWEEGVWCKFVRGIVSCF